MERSPNPAASMSHAVWFTGPEEVAIRDEKMRDPGPAEIRIHALASGISQGTEMLVYRGQVPDDLELDLPTLEGSYAFPIKFGYACVGRVDECGDSVKGFRRGDLVFAHHPHQTDFTVPAELAVPLPSLVDPAVGTLLANVETAMNVLLDANPRIGERVVIFGQGVVGLVVMMLLKQIGNVTVVAVEPSPFRAKVSRELGADMVVENPDDTVRAVEEATGGAGADISIESSGNAMALNIALDCLAFQGTAVVVSWYGSKPVPVQLGGRFHRQRLRVVSSQVGHVDPALQPRWNRSRRLDLATSLLSQLPLASLITDRVPFREAPKAYDQMNRSGDELLQVVLTYGDVDV